MHNQQSIDHHPKTIHSSGPTLIPVLLFLSASLLIGCSDTGGSDESTAGPGSGPEPSPPAAVQEEYGANSWRDLIPDSCLNFYDGCNNCTRPEAGADAACTRRACFTYGQPRCLDDQAAGEDEPQSSSINRTEAFQCDDGNRFSVVFGEYIADDQRVKLDADQIVLRDAQTHTATFMNLAPSASGARYLGDGLEFWSKGREAMVNRNGENLYSNCRTQQPR